MASPLILAIDQGTTSSRALVVDAGGAVRGVGQEPFTQYFPRPGRVEHDADEIWSSTEAAIGRALREAGVGPAGIVAIGIANQRETVVAWDRATGAPAGHAVVWQDRRTAAMCEELKAAGHEAAFAGATGLTLDPYFSATKIAWLLGEESSVRALAREGRLAVGTVDSWLTWKLTGGRRHVTDYTNASRTLLFDVFRGRWDERLCGLLGIDRAILPAAQPSQSRFGTTSVEAFGAEVPITGMAGDQQAALFGQACFARGQAKNTYGTGCFLLANAGAAAKPSANRLLVSLGAQAGAGGPSYVLEGSVFVAGALVQWLRDELGLFERAEDIEALAESVADTGDAWVVPAFTGLGAPYWDPRARGAILGLTRGTERAHIARAALEAIALSSAELVAAMNAELAAPITEIRVDGGAARNNLLMQMQADFAGTPVVRPAQTESTAMGAAFLAGIEAGVWSGPAEVAALWRAERTFEPRLGRDAREQKLGRWRSAVERALAWAAE